MNNNQSEALRLADALEQGKYLLSVERDATAAELRRIEKLERVNAELLEALRELLSEAEDGIATCPLTRIQARAAIAKAEEIS